LVRRKEMRRRTVEGRRAFNRRAVARDDGLSLGWQTAANLSFSLKTHTPAAWRGIAATAPGAGPLTTTISARGGDRRASWQCSLRRPSARMTRPLLHHLTSSEMPWLAPHSRLVHQAANGR